jgi:hypothetical protein
LFQKKGKEKSLRCPKLGLLSFKCPRGFNLEKIKGAEKHLPDLSEYSNSPRLKEGRKECEGKKQGDHGKSLRQDESLTPVVY